MFSEFALKDVNQECWEKSISVLHKLPEINGPQLVTSLIRPLVSLVNSNKKPPDDRCLEDDKGVQWIMEVICYGLSLPLSDNEPFDAVRDCVNIYCEWFHALSPKLAENKFIPVPIRLDPNVYCQQIIGHWYNIFLPRTFNSNDNTIDLVSRQALYCHRILRLIITIASDKDNVINGETWESLLIFLMGINEELLKSQTESNDIGTQISERVISTLFQGWLISCNHFFPSPTLWKTFQHICISLRHRPDLIIQWNRVNICLAKQLAFLLYGNEISLKFSKKNDYNQYQALNEIISQLKDDVLKQCWYRFLHIVGNPIELCFPEVIYKLDNFEQQAGLTTMHILPFIFHKAIKGLCTLVDIFLGLPTVNIDELEQEIPNLQNENNFTPPEKRKSNSSLGGKLEKVNHGLSFHNIVKLTSAFIRPSQQSLPTISLCCFVGNAYQNQIKSTSILDIFGKWLFQSSLICSSNKAVYNVLETSLSSEALPSAERMPTDESPYLPLDCFEAGQAEAIGALCRIFCFKKSDEDISSVLSKQSHPHFMKIKNYLTSYYLALKLGLSSTNDNLKSQLSSSILVNSAALFEVDLPGSKILIPHYLRCIEIFLAKTEKPLNDAIIRKACIKILISLLSFPLHYKNLPIKDNLSELPCNTFLSLFPRLVLLLIYGLYNEPDQGNVQMILSALLFIVEDSVYHDDLFSSDTLHEDSCNYDLASNLLLFFKFDYQNYFDFEKSELNCNMFLLIISFVAEILCKTSTTNLSSVSLVALEVLSALGRIHYKQQLLCNHRCILCIRQICTFIENQCYKPAMLHSRDMHSTIVAAYQCLSIWINQHSHLLKDKDCVLLLFELIELGISGTKSRKDNLIIKSDKQLKPTSMRVREAAEFLLTTLMSKIDLHQSNLSESILSGCLNEARLLENLTNVKQSEYAVNHFRFFVADNSMLISILDKQLEDGESVCIVRTAYGKYCWALRFQPLPSRHSPNHPNEANHYRSLNKLDAFHKLTNFNYFPEHYDKICNSKFDNMVLNLNNYINEVSGIKKEYDAMHNLIDKIENNLNFEKTKLTLTTNKKDFSEPPPCKTFEAYRLVLSQFKIFNFDKANVSGENSQNLVVLNHHSQSFIEHLSKLDLISSKNNDFVTIFFVPRAFEEERQIFQANLQQSSSNGTFREFLHSLGQSIDNKPNSTLFYWSDILHELVFTCPIISNEMDFSIKSLIDGESEHIRNVLLQANNGIPGNIKEYLLNNTGCDIKVCVLWMEIMEDFDRLPFKSLTTNSSEVCTIIVHPLKNGLFRVITHVFGEKFIMPLLDRMLLSKHLLTSYVRITALTLFRRRRMNIESFQLPHVKRRLKIQEINNKYTCNHSNQEFISELFRNDFL